MSATRSRVGIELLLVCDVLFCAPARFLKKNAGLIGQGLFLIFIVAFLANAATIPGIVLVMVAGAAGTLVAPFVAYVYAHLIGSLLIFGSVAAVLLAAFAWVHWVVFPRAVASAMAHRLGDTDGQPLPDLVCKKKGKSLGERWDDASDTTKIMSYYLVPQYIVFGTAAFIFMSLDKTNRIESFMNFACPAMFVITFVAVVHALVKG